MMISSPVIRTTPTTSTPAAGRANRRPARVLGSTNASKLNRRL